MADRDVGNPFGVNVSRDDNREASKEDADLLSISTMRARLAAIDAGLYTEEHLNMMTHNDMVYAIRVADSPSEI